jgi:hypothetical protein
MYGGNFMSAVLKKKSGLMGRAEAQLINLERHAITVPFADFQTNSGFSFVQRAVPLSRFGRYAVVDVEVLFNCRIEVSPDEYPDARKLISDTLTFLENYPEKKTYWEVYARDAAAQLFRNYGVFSSLTVILVIHPNDLRPYLRTATATVSGFSRRPSGQQPRAGS